MKLLTKELLKKLPAPRGTEGIPDPPAVIKFFSPTSNWRWYGTEYDPATRTFFGFVRGVENEWGYFSLDELESVKGPLGLGIERDLYWDGKTPMSKVVSGERI